MSWLLFGLLRAWSSQFFIHADVDPVPSSKKSSKSGVERMLEFGRELFQLSQRLEIEQGTNEANQKMLEVRVAEPNRRRQRPSNEALLFFFRSPGRLQFIGLLESVGQSARLAAVPVASRNRLCCPELCHIR